MRALNHIDHVTHNLGDLIMLRRVDTRDAHLLQGHAVLWWNDATDDEWDIEIGLVHLGDGFTN